MATRDFTKDQAGSDIILISIDKIEFFVHSANLSVGSQVFQGMFEVTKPETKTPRERVEMQESAEVIKAILPYVYPEDFQPLELKFPTAWPFVIAVHKYQIIRALEAVDYALRFAYINDRSPPSLEFCIGGYFLGSLYGRRTLKLHALQKIVELSSDLKIIRGTVDQILKSTTLAFSCEDELYALITSFFLAVEDVRREQGYCLARKKEHIKVSAGYHSSNSSCKDSLSPSYKVWLEASSLRSSYSIKEFSARLEFAVLSIKECEKCHSEVKAQLTKLARSIEELEKFADLK